MNQNLKHLLFWMTLVWSTSSNAQLQVIDLSTGWDNGMVATNTPDDTWTVTLPNNTVVTPRAATLSAWEETGVNHWISSSVWNGNATSGGIGGYYTYRATFTISTERLDCAKLVVRGIGGDNKITGMQLNGSSIPITLPAGDHFQLTNENVTFILNPAILNNGTNTLSITVQNTLMESNTNFTGLNFCGALHLNDPDFNIHPEVTGPTVICQGSPLTFGGGNAPGSNAPTHYFWRLLECDAAGNLVSGGFYWESIWYTGSPTNFTFPSNLNLTCGKYYMVALSAVRESACANWAQDLHVFNYVCKPTVNAGVDKTICQSECVTIGSSLPGKGVSYSWSANGTNVGTGIYLNVCPEVTTTYTVTATNNATGCTNTDQVVVTVLPNNPRFNISTNVSNNDYYTVTATPVVMNADNVPGFGAYWAVEELDANNNYVFYIQSPEVWYPYPATLNFKGFDDYALNYTGIVNWLPNNPTIGRFVYNKTYRITRGTWNDNCDWNAFAYIMTTTKTANGDSHTVVVEETKAPDFRPTILRATANIWQITPNPSNGIFQLTSKTEGMEETTVEVVDLFGKKIESKVIEAGTMVSSLDLTGNAPGIYMLNITVGGITNTSKIVIE